MTSAGPGVYAIACMDWVLERGPWLHMAEVAGLTDEKSEMYIDYRTVCLLVCIA